jgi:hypothetical protein
MLITDGRSVFASTDERRADAGTALRLSVRE